MTNFDAAANIDTGETLTVRLKMIASEARKHGFNARIETGGVRVWAGHEDFGDTLVTTSATELLEWLGY